MEPVKGLHHVTAVTRDAQHNVDFYRNILGQRLVKKTVNFDAPEAYHLYFANEIGTPGAGSIHHIAFRVPGGVLFEIATDTPGFAIDEPLESLGEALKQPEWFEPNRDLIERDPPPLELRPVSRS